MSKTGYIYKLCCNDPEITDCYVGSTKNEKVRKNGHKNGCNNSNNKSHNFNVYQFIRENGGWDNWNMVRIEEFKFNVRAELHTRERYWLEQLKATLNKIIPTRTLREHYQDNKKEINEKHKEYVEANKERVVEYKKKYYGENREHVINKAKEWRESNPERAKKKSKDYYEANKEVLAEKSKEYREANRDEILKKQYEYREAHREVLAQKQKEYAKANKENYQKYYKEYRQKNKQQIAEKMKEKTTCECGLTFRKAGKNRHLKSKKHKDYITSLDDPPKIVYQS